MICTRQGNCLPTKWPYYTEVGAMCSCPRGGSCTNFSGTFGSEIRHYKLFQWQSCSFMVHKQWNQAFFLICCLSSTGVEASVNPHSGSTYEVKQILLMLAQGESNQVTCRTVLGSLDPEQYVPQQTTTYPLKTPLTILVDPDVDKEVWSNKLEVGTKGTLGLDNSRFSRFSSWKRLLALVCIRCFIQRHRNAKSVSLNPTNDADLFLDAEKRVIKDVQRSVYQEEINCLRSTTFEENSPSFTLGPYLDANELLRVGERLKNSRFDTTFKNPVILPAKHHIETQLW